MFETKKIPENIYYATLGIVGLHSDFEHQLQVFAQHDGDALAFTPKALLLLTPYYFLNFVNLPEDY